MPVSLAQLATHADFPPYFVEGQQDPLLALTRRMATGQSAQLVRLEATLSGLATEQVRQACGLLTIGQAARALGTIAARETALITAIVGQTAQAFAAQWACSATDMPQTFFARSVTEPFLNGIGTIPQGAFLHLNHMWDDLTAPGTWNGDLRLLEDTGASDEQRVAAIDRAVARIRWYPRDYRTRVALRRRAEAEGVAVSTVIRSEMRQAILLVLGEADRAQRHRFDGRMYLVVPREEGLHDYWTWIADETRKAAAASIRGEPYPPAAYDALRERVLVSSDVVAELSDPATDPLALLERAETQHDIMRMLDGMAPRERDVCALLERGASPAEIADELGMSRNAVDQCRHRIRRRFDRRA